MNIINYQIIYHHYYLLIQLLELCNFLFSQKTFLHLMSEFANTSLCLFYLICPNPFIIFSTNIFQIFLNFFSMTKSPISSSRSKSFQIYHSFPQYKTISVFLNSFFNSKKCPVRTDLDLDKAIRRRERKR